MASKVWNGLVITYYISYLFLIIPPLGLYFLFSNGYKRSRNRTKVRRIIKKGGLPKDIQKEVRKSYRESLNTFKILNLVKNMDQFSTSSKEEDTKKFSKIFKTVLK